MQEFIDDRYQNGQDHDGNSKSWCTFCYMRNIRRLKEGDANAVCSLFPTIPKADISSYVFHHPSLTIVDYVAHFLEQAEPTGKVSDLQTQFLIAQARSMFRNSKANAPPLQPIAPARDPLLIEIEKKVNCFPIPSPCRQIAGRLFTQIMQLRIQKKRSRFQDEDYLTRMAFAYASELQMGYIGLDSNDWEIWLTSHSDLITEECFICGMVTCVADAVRSICAIIDHEPEMRKILTSTARFAGVGISISKQNSFFFVVFVGNRK